VPNRDHVTRPAAGILLGVLVSVLLSACGGGGDPATAGGSPSASTTRSSWPPGELLLAEEPEPPVLTGDGRPADVQPIVRHLVAQMTHALRTTFPPTDLAARPKCALCAEIVELAEQARADRIVYELDAWEPELGDIEVLPGDGWAKRYFRVPVRLNRPELRAVDEHGKVVDLVPASDAVTLLALRGGERWEVMLWDDLEELKDRGEA
jgi:hypothetical protein